MSELIRDTLEADFRKDPVADARAYFERSKPLQSFAKVDAETYVRSIRSKSRILRTGDGACYRSTWCRTPISSLIYRKKSPATVERFLSLLEAQTTMLICPIVVAEVYAGAFKKEHKDVEALFDLWHRIDRDSDTGRMAGLYANQYAEAYPGIALEDYLLAVTASAHRCPLWTLYRKYYPVDDAALFGV